MPSSSISEKRPWTKPSALALRGRGAASASSSSEAPCMECASFCLPFALRFEGFARRGFGGAADGDGMSHMASLPTSSSSTPSSVTGCSKNVGLAFFDLADRCCLGDTSGASAMGASAAGAACGSSITAVGTSYSAAWLTPFAWPFMCSLNASMARLATSISLPCCCAEISSRSIVAGTSTSGSARAPLDVAGMRSSSSASSSTRASSVASTVLFFFFLRFPSDPSVLERFLFDWVGDWIEPSCSAMALASSSSSSVRSAMDNSVASSAGRLEDASTSVCRSFFDFLCLCFLSRFCLRLSPSMDEAGIWLASASKMAMSPKPSWLPGSPSGS
jgi:hypothetical protein